MSAASTPQKQLVKRPEEGTEGVGLGLNGSYASTPPSSAYTSVNLKEDGWFTPNLSQGCGYVCRIAARGHPTDNAAGGRKVAVPVLQRIPLLVKLHACHQRAAEIFQGRDLPGLQPCRLTRAEPAARRLRHHAIFALRLTTCQAERASEPAQRTIQVMNGHSS
jgi:hypothetical protein